MKNITCGIVAHVDSGKTTLSEALLYNAGNLRKLGRVDHKDSFLDTDPQEMERGITIYSKPAILQYKDMHMTLVDTPGHVDFSIEAERAIWVLDYAILLISASDLVLGHTKTLFRLLCNHNIPTIIFVNKIDIFSEERQKVLSAINTQLSDKATTFDDDEAIAMLDENVLEEYICTEHISKNTKVKLFNAGKFFPVFYGSALKNDGVIELLDFLEENTIMPEDNAEFAGRVYKVESLSHDKRLSFMKITSGKLQVKATLSNGEKVDQIRIYSGNKYQQVNEAQCGDIVAIAGPKETYPGQGLGTEKCCNKNTISPVLEYVISFKDNTIPKLAFNNLVKLSDEDPSLHIVFDEQIEQIKIQLMGEIQTQIIQKKIYDIFGYEIEFSKGTILYKETITTVVEGVGHFEPLRHYAEVHLLMEPLPSGSGIVVKSDVSCDDLALNWQRLIETHILEKEHTGVLANAPLTDIQFTIVGGRDHLKHTEGGDFREATYRAIRQGLMESESELLEPYFKYELTIPSSHIGRAMSDLKLMDATISLPEEADGMSILKGTAPVATIRNYQSQVVVYSKGAGSLILEMDSYRPCHNKAEVLDSISYNPNEDSFNPSGSVFCSHGAGEYVPWNEVKARCHVSCISQRATEQSGNVNSEKREIHTFDEWIDVEEIDSILQRATHSNQGKNSKKNWNYNKRIIRKDNIEYEYHPQKVACEKKKYMLVDGYNLIYAWDELRKILEDNLDGARGKLLDILSNYQAMTDYEIIVVFDAYKIKNHAVEIVDYQNIHQVFTATAQTADAYIAKFSHDNKKNYDVTVVTSDGMEQIIIRGQGAKLISSREFIVEIARKSSELRERYGIL